MEKDLETFSHLLANPYFCKRGNTIEERNIDQLLLNALQDKFPSITITEKEYYQNISKIEKLLTEIIIKNSIDIIIQKIENVE